MNLFYVLVLPVLAACAALQTTSNQKNAHISKTRQSFNQADYGNIISRATGGIPETDDDIEPMMEVGGKRGPLKYKADTAFFQEIKERYPNLRDGTTKRYGSQDTIYSIQNLTVSGFLICIQPQEQRLEILK
ncbi:hypothetical protein LX36DRAFT_699734 [Colletotrichum falcatum]|nr:hypothetical protein LX36DRAFT_699734 [Colletotrichum falcatum]